MTHLSYVDGYPLPWAALPVPSGDDEWREKFTPTAHRLAIEGMNQALEDGRVQKVLDRGVILASGERALIEARGEAVLHGMQGLRSSDVTKLHEWNAAGERIYLAFYMNQTYWAGWFHQMVDPHPIRRRLAGEPTDGYGDKGRAGWKLSEFQTSGRGPLWIPGHVQPASSPRGLF